MDKDKILWYLLLKHVGHRVEIAIYGNENDVCLECLDCNEVLLDADIYTICAREDDPNEIL